MRDRPGVVIRSLPDTSAMYPSMISRISCSKGIFAGGSFTADVLPTLSRDANSSRVSVFDSATMIRVWPFSVIGVWSILLRSAKASVGASFQKLTCSWRFLGIFSAPRGKSRSPKTDLPTSSPSLARACRTRRQGGHFTCSNASAVIELGLRKDVTTIRSIGHGRGLLCWPDTTTPTIATSFASGHRIAAIAVAPP